MADSPSKNRSPADSPMKIGFVLVPSFSLIAFSSAIEPLRLANRCSKRNLYDWELLSVDGCPVRASNGVTLAVDRALGAAGRLDLLLIASGLDVEAVPHAPLASELRRRASFGTHLGALCTGAHLLAKTGLLDGYRATIHWENRTGLLAAFPHLEVSEELFEIDRTRLTCAGGTAAIDMMLAMITRDHGLDTAIGVTDQLIHQRMRDATERQRTHLQTRHGAAQPRLLKVVARMEGSIEAPVSCERLAQEAGISIRQLERLFLKSFGMSPTRYYISLRLEHARRLLRQTSMTVIDVAVATGFVSASHFSKSYHAHFGAAPSGDRIPGDPSGKRRQAAIA